MKSKIHDQKPDGCPRCAGASGSASSRDITEDEEYQKFVESMVQYCHCHESLRPCDGVLAGGLCDCDNQIADPRDDDDYEYRVDPWGDDDLPNGRDEPRA